MVVACLGYSRTGAGALIFSKAAPDIVTGIVRCVWRLALELTDRAFTREKTPT